MKVCLLVALYALTVLVAYVNYRPEHLVYGLASWCGGVAFTLLVQEYARLRRQRG